MITTSPEAKIKALTGRLLDDGRYVKDPAGLFAKFDSLVIGNGVIKVMFEGQEVHAMQIFGDYMTETITVNFDTPNLVPISVK